MTRIIMRKAIFISVALILFAFTTNAQTKKDGTPDMRYNANKQTYGTTSTPSYNSSKATTPSYSTTPSYTTPKTTPSYSQPKSTERNYSNGGQYKVQDGYQKSNGTYVAPHVKTTPDNKTWNNYKQK